MTTTTLQVMVLCSGTLAMTATVMMVPAMVGPPAALGQQGVGLAPPLNLRDTRGVVGLTTVIQQLPQSKMPFQAYTNCAMGPPQVSFFFRVEPLTNLSIYVGSPLWCMLSTFRFPCGCLFDLWWAQPLGFTLQEPLGAYPWQAYVHPGDGLRPRPGMHWVAAPSMLQMGSLMLLSSLSSNHSSSMVGHVVLWAWQRVT